MRKRQQNRSFMPVMLVIIAVITVISICLVAILGFSAIRYIADTPILANTNIPVFAETTDSVEVGGYAEEPPDWIIMFPEPEIEYEELPYVPNATYVPYIPNATHNFPAPSPFALLPFYIVENSQAYAYFHVERPYLDYEEVVWKVNVFLHVPFYSEIRIDNNPNPLLVSPAFRLPYYFTPAELVPVNEDNPNIMATPATVEAFRSLRTAAIADGLDIAAVSGYRPASRQRVIFGNQSDPYRVPAAVARPYHSEHQTGRAIDLWGPTPSGLLDATGPPSAVGLWVAANAHYHGFIVRYTAENSHITSFISEPWHITYVGREIAKYIVNNNLSSLEEFVGRNPGVTLP